MKMFGEFLVEEGFVTSAQLADGLFKQRAMREQPIGEVLVDLRIMSRKELDAVLPRYYAELASSAEKRRRFGEFLIDQELVSADDLERGLREQHRLRGLRIGEVLVRLGHLSPAALERAVQMRLGEMVAMAG